jgi:acyl-CoA synthetase (AMP-forming)/AMP-acid ligase II
MTASGETLSYVDAVRARVAAQPSATAFIFLGADGSETSRLSYAGLDARARSFAASLGARVDLGARVAIMTEEPLQFITAFIGILYAGCVAVPVNLPSRGERVEKVLAIVTDSGASLLVVSDAIFERAATEPLLQGLVQQGAMLRFAELDGAQEPSTEVVRRHDLAFLQYTSGSTGAPKGVMVSHDNLVANMRMIARALGPVPGQNWVSWLPLFHDMGLVGSTLNSIFSGATTVLLTPQAFVRRPGLWLEAISRYRAVGTGGPNFGYELCARIYERRDCSGLDLSSWRVAYNGAEPVRLSTLRRFERVFAKVGFRATAHFPCYGMAEATLFIAGGPRERELRVESVLNSELGFGRATPAPAATEAGALRNVVGCGEISPDLTLRIVDPETRRPCAPRSVGEIWVSGRSICQGYWQLEAPSREAFGAHLLDGEGPYLRTGDLGYVVGGELFVTGRSKDLIILNGRNFYPQDIEQAAVEGLPILEGRAGAAFSVEGEAGERLVLVQELARQSEAGARDRLRDDIKASVREQAGALVHEVVFIQPASLPRTTSGKVRRRETKARYAAGTLQLLTNATLE